jgi:hypothetical protein
MDENPPPEVIKPPLLDWQATSTLFDSGPWCHELDDKIIKEIKEVALCSLV